MNKSELTAQLENCKNNWVLGLAAIHLLTSEQSQSILTNGYVTFGTYTVTFDQVLSLLANKSDRDIAIKEFTNMLLRSLVTGAFSVIKMYCLNTKQVVQLQIQPWYKFARLIMDSLINNGVFLFSTLDDLPITWHGKTITANMDGQPLKLEFFGYVQAWELFLDIQDFAQTLA